MKNYARHNKIWSNRRMPCPTKTAPLNIVATPNKVCSRKCAYSFQYPISNLLISNQGDHLTLKTEVTKTPPVIYNGGGYSVQEMRLYRPSIHQFNGVSTSAELIIVHNSLTGSGTLLVCVPLMLTENSTSDGAALLDLIVNEAKQSANSAGQQTTLTVSKLSLDALIPLKPFFSYKGGLPYNEDCQSRVNYVVFAGDDAMEISSNAFNVLKNSSNGILKAHNFELADTANNKSGLFYNATGAQKLAVTQGGSNDIWIDCQPTGAEGEVLVPNNKTSAQMFDMDPIRRVLTNGLFQTLIGVILMVGILKVGKIMLKKISAPNTVGAK